MIATTIAFFATGIIGAALGYYWGKQDSDAYTEGVAHGVSLQRSVLVHLNRAIRTLEQENDQLRARLKDEAGPGIEDQYIEEDAK